MAILKFDLLFDLVTQLFDLWPRKTIEFFLVHDFINGPSLVTIIKKLRPVSRAKQTDRQTDKHAVKRTYLQKFLWNFGK